MTGTRTAVYCLDGRGALADSVERSGGTVTVEPRGPGFDPRAILRLAAFLRRQRACVVHTHALDPMFYAAFAAVLARTPVRVHTQHNTFIDTWDWKDRLKFRIAARFFTALAGVSEESLRGMLRAGAPPKRALTVLNGIDCTAYAGIQKLTGDRQVAGAVGRLAPEKGIDDLLRAFAAVRSGMDASLLIAGDGPDRMKLEALAAELGIGDAVEFAGYTANVAEALARMDVFVLPSRSEGIPLALLEAMAAGLPVVAARVGGVPEVVADGETGVLVPPGDPPALAAAMADLLSDPLRRREAGERGRARVRRHFSHTRMAQSYRSLYSAPAPSWRDAAKRATHLLPSRLLCWRGSGADHSAAVTFDDGPDPVYTPRVLDILRRYGVSATFFLLGERAARYPDLVKRILDDGHELGNHSFTHPFFERLSLADACAEVDRTQEVLEKLQNRPCRLFRPPRGKLCLASLTAAWRRNLTVVMWSIDLKDFASNDAEQIRRAAALKPARDGDIVLYHGLSDASVAGLPSVLELAAETGNRLLPVSRVAGLGC
jgi:glycosyltransferase involved in cell wall biosynthesis